MVIVSILMDAVRQIRIFRKQPLAEGGFSLVEVCNVAPNASAQKEFSCQATFPASLLGAHALYAFVESTDRLVPWPLEVKDDARVVLTVGSPPVFIPDPNLERVVRLAIRKSTGTITEADMLRLVEIHYGYEQGITSLEGLQYAKNLEIAAINHNQISDLTPLAGLTKLNWLVLTVNRITSVEPLRGLVNLDKLYIDHNQIANVGPLLALVKLTSLDLGVNLITDVTPLAGMVNLDWIALGYNRLTRIDAVAGMTKVFSVTAAGNQIMDLTPVVGLTNLKFLFMEGNLISDISPLVANPGLAAGDFINLRENCLDLAPGTRAAEDLAALLGRGLAVYSENQTCGH